MSDKKPLKKYNFKAWTMLPCPLPYETTGPMDGCDCNKICGENEDDHPCKEITYVRTNSRIIFKLKLILCKCLYDIIEMEYPDKK